MKAETHIKDNSMESHVNTQTMKNTMIMQREMDMHNVYKDEAGSRNQM